MDCLLVMSPGIAPQNGHQVFDIKCMALLFNGIQRLLVKNRVSAGLVRDSKGCLHAMLIPILGESKSRSYNWHDAMDSWPSGLSSWFSAVMSGVQILIGARSQQRRKKLPEYFHTKYNQFILFINNKKTLSLTPTNQSTSQASSERCSAPISVQFVNIPMPSSSVKATMISRHDRRSPFYSHGLLSLLRCRHFFHKSHTVQPMSLTFSCINNFRSVQPLACRKKTTASLLCTTGPQLRQGD